MEQTIQQTQPKKGGNKAIMIILIVMIVILAAASGWLVWQFINNSKVVNGMKIKETELTTTVDNQKKDLDSLKIELDKMAGAIPGAVADSLRNVITDLEGQLETAKANRIVYTGGGGGGNKKEIEALKEEITAWQSKYDKLVQELNAVKQEKDKLAADKTILEKEKTDMAITNKVLQDKVTAASQLKFYETLLTGYKLDKKGNKKFEEKAKKVMGFEVSFKIQENAVADEGERMAYIVINGPNKKVLTESTANVFQVGGVDRVFTIQKSFYFNNKVASITSEYKTAEGLKAGEYTVEVYVDGVLCTTSSTFLK